MSWQTAYVKHTRPIESSGPQQSAMSPQTCLIKSGAHTNAIRWQRILAHVGIFYHCPAWLSAYRVQLVCLCGGRPKATERIPLPSRSRQARPRLYNPMHAIIRFTRYIADLGLREHHYYRFHIEHAPRSCCYERAVTASSLHFQATVSPIRLRSHFLCKRLSSWCSRTGFDVACPSSLGSARRR